MFQTPCERLGSPGEEALAALAELGTLASPAPWLTAVDTALSAWVGEAAKPGRMPWGQAELGQSPATLT